MSSFQTVCKMDEDSFVMERAVSWTWAAAMMRSDKEPLDLVFLMVLRDLTDVSALSTNFRELHQL